MNFARTWLALTLCGAASTAWIGCSDDSSDAHHESVDSGIDNSTGSSNGNGGGNPGKPSLDGSISTTRGDAASAGSDAASAPGSDEDAGGHSGGDDAGAVSHADAGSSTCGSRSQVTCKANEYCAYPLAAQCGAADQGGQCMRRPNVCPQDIVGTGVCGCNGKTYGNACMAESAGTSVAHEGECTGSTPQSDAGVPPTGGQGEGMTCAGIAGLKCAAGLFCEWPVGCAKNVADAAGRCARIPTQCGPGNAQPICGCDGKSYKSLCEANMQSVSLDHTGACK